MIGLKEINTTLPGGLIKRTASILTGLSLAVLSFVASAHAQYNQRLTANVPFEFTTGNTSLPAGQYDFLRTGDNILQVRDRTGRSVFTMASASVQPNQLPEKSTLKFATVDGRRVLIQIWNGRTGIGYEFVDRQSYLELARRAAIHVPSQTAN